MKVEVLASGGIRNAFKDLGIEAIRTYYMSDAPHYEIWEIEKNDLHKLEDTNEWKPGYGNWAFAKKSNMGTPFDFFTVNGQFMIGWATKDGKDKYDKLTDYFNDGLGINQLNDVCACASELAHTNGMLMSKLFKTFEG